MLERAGKFIKAWGPTIGAGALMAVGVIISGRRLPEDIGSLDISKSKRVETTIACAPAHITSLTSLIDWEHYDLILSLKEPGTRNLWRVIMDLDNKSIIAHPQPLSDRNTTYMQVLHNSVSEAENNIVFTKNQRLRIVLFEGDFNQRDFNQDNLVAGADVTFPSCY